MDHDDYQSSNTVTLRIPYYLLRKDLVLDGHSENVYTVTERLEWLLTDRPEPSELERILRSTVLLFEAKAGTIAQCLDTAIIWERG